MLDASIYVVLLNLDTILTALTNVIGSTVYHMQTLHKPHSIWKDVAIAAVHSFLWHSSHNYKVF